MAFGVNLSTIVGRSLPAWGAAILLMAHTMTSFFRHFFVLALVFLVSACTSYQYVPPASEAGRQCVTTCDTNRQICIAGREQAAASQNQACETRRAVQLASCLATAFTPEARNYCNKVAPTCSSNFASTGACDDGYRACYVQCGGRVIEVKD